MQNDLNRPLVLAVDDEPGVLESYKVILEDTCEVRTAADGSAALKVLAREDIRLVILDLRLPDMEGLQVLSRIKEMDEYLGVIIVTAVGDVKPPSALCKRGRASTSSSRSTSKRSKPLYGAHWRDRRS